VTPNRPSPSEYFSYFERYLARVPESDVLPVLKHQIEAIRRSFAKVSDERAGFRYAPEKWSVRQVLGHIIDAERVFGYRALCIARGERISLPSFEEDQYVATAGHDRFPLPELVEEFSDVRRSNLHLFAHLEESAWERIGVANDHPLSTRAVEFIMAGHLRHHGAVLTERYGIAIEA